MAQLFLNQVEAFSRYQEQEAERQTLLRNQESAAAQSDPDGDKITLRRRPPPATEPPAGPRLDAVGKIVAVKCDGFALDLTLTSPGRTLSLRTENYYKLEFEAVNWEPPPNFNPCNELEGRNARVVYVASTAAKDAGVLLTVEVRGSDKK